MLLVQQPILSRNKEVLGYSFSIRSTHPNFKTENKKNIKDIISLFSNYNTEKLLNKKFAFLPYLLETDEDIAMLSLLGSKNIVLNLDLTGVVSEKQIEEIAQKIRLAKSQGYQISINYLFIKNEFKEILGLTDFVVFTNIQPGEVTAENMQLIYKVIKICIFNKKKVIVDGVNSVRNFELFQKMGFEYYQGYFFAKPVNLEAKVTNPAISSIFKLMNLLIKEADFKEIEKLFKTDTTLTYKLLRYVNSYGNGAGQKIESISRALNILGYRNLRKWVSILFTALNKTQGSDLVSKTALIRARFMEIVAQKIDKSDVDNYFMVGLFSLLDVMLHVKIDIAINSINLNSEIKDAVMLRKGKYASLLRVIELLEEENINEITPYLFELGIDQSSLHEFYFEALSWVSELQNSK